MIQAPPSDATFELFNLRVEISEKSGHIIGEHKIGDYFEVVGENIFFPMNQGFSLYALAALLPLLPAKQRFCERNDWMNSDEYVADPDPNNFTVYRIIRTGKTTFLRNSTTVTPLSHPLL